MKLLTLNTHSWQEDNQIEKINIVAKAIVEQNCDLIALQEVNQHINSLELTTDILSNKKVLEDNYAYLLQQKLIELGHAYQLTWDFIHHSYGVYQEGLSFLTRIPILEREVIDLNDHYNESFWKHRRAVRIKINYQGREIDMFNCHCGWWNDQDSPFELHIERLTDKLTSRLGFLLGDFNNASHIRNQGYDHVLQQGLFDSYTLSEKKDEGFTVVKNIDGWKENSNKLRIDYIFCNQGVSIKQHRTIFNGVFYPVVSDHFGLLVDLDF